MRTGPRMAFERYPIRDPRTVARDIPGVLDVLFPRLKGGLVTSLNRQAVSYEGVEPVVEELVAKSRIKKALLFEIAMVQAEHIVNGEHDPSLGLCSREAWVRQSRHYKGRPAMRLADSDVAVVKQTSINLVTILRRLQEELPNSEIEVSPAIPGLGWISSGNADYSLGPLLIEVKNTDRNFISNDFRQILMYWLLRYNSIIETRKPIWTTCVLLNPRRNFVVKFGIDFILESASSNLNRVELNELLRSLAGGDLERR